MARVAGRALCLIALFAAAAVPLLAQGGITYVYDDLGRLVAVIDPSGDTARYHYDAVGNLLSISRAPSSQVSILYFSPGKGPIGTQVTIYGTSFSTTPSQNTVTFNGTAATVVSSTATQIVAIVPSSATTGPIGVTAPAGSATSATPFTVTASGEPTIASFTPNVGAPSETVDITGTNFDPAPANNKIKFNLVAAPTFVNTVTATDLTATVPLGATSGRLTLTTPVGTTTSTADFFVPPSPYTSADVALTTRMSIGSTTPVTIGTSGKIALIIFDGTAGQRLSLHASNSSINSAVITIYTPGGGTFSSTSSFTSGGFFIEPQALPVSGTYTIMVDPNGTVTGSLTLGIYDVVDWSGYTSRSGPPVAISLSTPGQNGNLLWSGNSGEQFSFKVTGIAIGGSTGLTILNPDGSTMVPLTYMSSGGTTFVDQKTTATGGNYTINVNPSVGNTGSATLTLYDATDFTGTITPGGPWQTATITNPGQNAKLTFTGNAGQRVSLKVDNITIPNYGGSAITSVLKPDGSTLTSLGTHAPWISFLDTQTLPVSGTYTVLVDAIWMNTGNATLTLYDVADISGTITPGGSPVTTNITTPGQKASYTFSGVSGQRISMYISGSTLLQGNCSILKPDGSSLYSTSFGTTPFFIEPLTLPAGGTYTLVVDPTSYYTGSVTTALYDVPANITGAITIGGPSVAITIAAPGQNATLAFDANGGQQISLQATSVTIPSSTVYIRKPDGTNVVLASVGTSGAFFDKQTLPVTGTYSIFVDPSYQYTGNMTLTLYDATDVTGAITPSGPAVTPTITSPGQNAQYTWSGTAGQLISLRVTNVTMSTFVSVKKPDGTTLFSAGVTSGNQAYFDRTSLPSTGTYTVLVNPSGTVTGSVTLMLYDVVDITGPVTPGGTWVTAVITTPGQNAEYTFTGNAGQNISLSMSGITISLSVVTIKKPDGTTLIQTGGITTSSAFIDRTSLPTSGTYTIQVNPNWYNTGNMTLTLHDLMDASGSLTINDPATPATINLPGQLANLTFDGTASQQVTVRLTGNTMGNVTVKLFKPDGTQLTSATSGTSSFNLSQQTLPTTGTYTVVVDPATTNTGSMNVQVTSP